MTMTLFSKNREKNVCVVYWIQLVCLLIAATYEFLIMEATIFSESLYDVFCIGAGVACFAFWIAAFLLSSPKPSWRRVLPGAVMVLWFLVVGSAGHPAPRR